MSTWVALLRKDFRLTRTVFFVGLVMNVLMVMLSIYVGMKANSLFMFIPIVVAIGFHILYVPIMVFMSLRAEAHELHLWLHNPQPASSLLSSKIVNGLIMIVISLLTLYVVSGLLIIFNFNLIEAYWADAWMSGLLIFLHIIMVSIMMGVWVMFLWTLYQSLKSRIGRWSWLVVIGVVIGSGWIFAYFESTSLYRVVTNWGGIVYHFPSFSLDIQTYTGEYMYNFIIIIGLFLLSAWIIDNKVEV